MRTRRDANPFAGLPRTPANHFRLHFYTAVEQLRRSLPEPDGALGFLRGYYRELPDGWAQESAADRSAHWWQAVRAWERDAPGHLPLRALREAAGLDPLGLTLLFAIGLPEEDGRFGALFDALQGTSGLRRPTAGLLGTWWDGGADSGGVRAALAGLLELGLVEVADPQAPRSEWALRASSPAWDAARGDQGDRRGLLAGHRPAAELVALPDLIAAEPLAATLAAVPGLFGPGRARTLVVRGPRSSGRRTVVGAVAHRLGRGLLLVDSVEDLAGWAGPVSTLLGAVPVVVLQPGPGETVTLPRVRAYAGPVGVVLERHGGVDGPGMEDALTLTLGMPDPAERERHWRAALERHPAEGVADLAATLRMTGGNIRRTAGLACAEAALAGRPSVTPADVRRASRALHHQVLETKASRVEATGDWSGLAVGEETARELALLERRCRHRELLPDAVGPALAAQLTPGVRALFTGPSGTGKTLAARLLAAVLDRDLYALDLSTVVSKYLGETEKNLGDLLSRAEELDVVLLLDEGDSLLTQRTEVRTSNDRYANLETNFLLQRLESFEGILVVTTNAGERIDAAFRRRIDVVVEFRAPAPAERRAIWRLHLPAGHAVEDAFLDEVAGRCALTGGQIRNAVLHATLLALDDGDPVTARQVEAAVRREYRKAGAVCPLRPRGAWAGV
jgi:hypothetical protein